MPKVSVLIPVYNREKYIVECIDSVLRQEFQDWEIVCCDNASTDGTFAILQQYAARDPRIRIFSNDTNLGPIPNWKRCLDEARGAYVHWLWSDDFIHDGDFYGKMFATAAAQGTDVAMCAARLLNEGTGHMSVLYSLHVQFLDMRRMLENKLQFPVSPAAWILPTELVRKYFFENIPASGGFDCNKNAIGADLLMILGACLDRGRVGVHGMPLVTFRAHKDSISLLNRTKPYYQVARSWFVLEYKVPLGWSARISLLKMIRYGIWGRALRILFHS